MRLRVLTYNIHRAIGIDRRFQPERIQEVLEHYAADVVLLQEVDEGAPRSRELELARELAAAAGYTFFAAGYNVTLERGRYGNATLSRFPIQRERNIDLTIDGRKRRGCQHTTLELGEERLLEVFNLHLGLSVRERTHQLGLLIRAREFADLPAESACLVGGDFNDWRSLLHPILTEVHGFHCATRIKRLYARSIPTYPAFSPTGGLDKVYYRGPLRLIVAARCRLRVSRVASDHLPVICDFELP